jgi:hypothetical protein
MSQKFPEPKFLRWLRIGVGLLAVTIYLCYLAFLTWGVIKDTPVLRLSLEKLDELKVPGEP